MDTKEYIESGILELYVAGTLSEEENNQVFAVLNEYPEVLAEVEKIEKTISQVTSSVAPNQETSLFKSLLIKMVEDQENAPKVIPLKQNHWLRYTGWAASILIGTGLIYTLTTNSSLSNEVNTLSEEKQEYQEQLIKTEESLKANETLLAAIRGKDIISVPLQGQTVSPDSYAKIYWDKASETIYVDVQGLPDPPEGKVYQLWSLTLNPLTPTSLGTIDGFIADADKIFTVKNPNESQAFGITLEPAGGSASPTLEQLYTLGAISS